MIPKKAIGAVVATGLLLVVAVVGVVTFQTWFNTYSSSLQNEVESQSSTSLNTRIDRVIGETLYFRNGGNENISVDRVAVGGQDCNISQNVSSGVNILDLGNCTSNITESVTDVVVYTDDGVYSQEIFLDSVTSSSSGSGDSSFSLNCSSLPGDWSGVPGNSNLNTSDFCVMTYEAKDVSGIATSQPSQLPWNQIDQPTARTECSNLGSRYHLMTDAQWVTMSRNIEKQAENWADGNIGSTVSSGGGIKRGNIGVDDNGSYDGSDPADRSIDSNTKAMHNLSTGDVVWDISGNLWEWTNETFDTDSGDFIGKSSSGWYEWTEVDNSNYGHLEPSNNMYNSTFGVGRIYVKTDPGLIQAYQRGADWSTGSISSGVFTMRLHHSPSLTANRIGFRCTYTS